MKLASHREDETIERKLQLATLKQDTAYKNINATYSDSNYDNEMRKKHQERKMLKAGKETPALSSKDEDNYLALLNLHDKQQEDFVVNLRTKRLSYFSKNNG